MFRPSYTRLPSEMWEGVVKDESGKIIATCGHAHECRDYNHSRHYQHTGAAMDCARRMAWEMNGKPDLPYGVPGVIRGIPKMQSSAA